MTHRPSNLRAGLLGAVLLAGLATVWGAAAGAEPAPAGPTEAGTAPWPQDEAEDVARQAFAAAGIQVERAAGSLAFPAAVEIRADALEYLLVTPVGAVHEALFVTEADPELLNAGFLFVGAEPGQNVEYTPIDPPPTREEVRAGAPTHDVKLPSGEPIYVYAAWREPAGTPDAETGAFPDRTLHFHRVEDLILDLDRQRTLRRHGWVYLGSRTIPGARPGEPERFAASATGNLVCTTFFVDGDTLLTTALPESTSQTIWYPNNWLLPPRGSEVLLIASRTELDTLPAAYAESVPFVAEAGAGD